MCTVHKIAYYKSDETEEEVRVGTCSTHSSMRNSFNILFGKLTIRDNLVDLEVDGRII
jgi:hypothetical protein